MNSDFDFNPMEETNESGFAENHSTKENDFFTNHHEKPMGRQRMRIHTQKAYSSDNQNNYNDNRRSFRPEGFALTLEQSRSREGRMNYNDMQQEQGMRQSYYNRQQGYQRQDRYYNNNPRRNNNYYDRNENEGFGAHAHGRDNDNTFAQRGYGDRYRPQNNFRNPNNNYGQRNGFRSGYMKPRMPYNRPGDQQQGYGHNYGNAENQSEFFPNNTPTGNYYNRRPARPYGQSYNPQAKYNMKKRIEYNESHIDPDQPLRLNKYLANAGVCSRREADQYIESGVVKVNGEVVKELGTKVLRTDVVTFSDRPVTLEKKVYVLINKPKNCVTTNDDPQQRKTVMDIVANVCPERIYPVGRLDRNTTGVLLLTNDGDLASKLAHPKFLKKKVYHVFLDKVVAEEDMKKIAEGIMLDDGEIHADAIDYADENDKTQVGIEIHSGKNRIVRRIFESLGYKVVKLDRVQFAGLTKKNLRRGDWRFLTENEVNILRMGAFE